MQSLGVYTLSSSDILPQLKLAYRTWSKVQATGQCLVSAHACLPRVRAHTRVGPWAHMRACARA